MRRGEGVECGVRDVVVGATRSGEGGGDGGFAVSVEGFAQASRCAAKVKGEGRATGADLVVAAT